jgi:hypothetical protein
MTRKLGMRSSSAMLGYSWAAWDEVLFDRYSVTMHA